MIGQLHHRGGHYLLLAAIAAVIFFLNLGGASLWDVDEGRNSGCFMEMMESGNWIVPYFNSKLRVDKPVLLYWLQIMSALVFGLNEFSARFPSAVAALGTVFLCYELARSMFGRTTGLLAGVIIATTPMLCGAARFANPDALLNACTVLTLTVFWLGRIERPRWWFVALGAASGLGVLAKGPVGLVLPGAVLFLFLLWERQLSIYWDRRWLLACVTFAFVGLPWYIWVGVETHGDYLTGFLWKHNVDRALAPMEDHHGFPGYYLCVLLIGTAPWSIFLFAAFWFAFWSAIRHPWARCSTWWSYAAESAEQPLRDEGAERDVPAAYRLLACWIAVYCLFFSIAATKLPNYVLPVVAPCAIVIARLLDRWQSGRLPLPNWLVQAGILSLILGGIGLSLGLALASGVVTLALLKGKPIQGLEPFIVVGLFPLLAGMAGWWFVRRQQYRRYLLALSISAVATLGPLAAYGSMIFNRYKAPQPLVAEARALSRAEDIRIAGWQMEHLPSLNFYVQRNVEHLTLEKDLAGFLFQPLPSYLFLPRSEWERLQPSLQGLGRVVARQHDMYHRNEVVVVTNRAAENPVSPLSLAR